MFRADVCCLESKLQTRRQAKDERWTARLRKSTSPSASGLGPALAAASGNANITVKSRKCGQAVKNSLSPSVPGLTPSNRPNYSNPCALTKSQALNPRSNPKAPNRHSCGALVNMCPIRVASWHFDTCNARGRKKGERCISL